MLDEFWAAVTGKPTRSKEKDHIKCRGYVNEIYKTSPEIQFMVRQLQNRNCAFKKKILKCIPCAEQITGGFHPEKGILLCENSVNKSLLRDTILHELVHYYDNCVYDMENWQNCYLHACSEIRAAHLSGDCRWFNEFRRGHFEFTGHLQDCVKRRAALSLKGNPNCTKDPDQYVNAVFDKCFKNLEPFGQIYR